MIKLHRYSEFSFYYKNAPEENGKVSLFTLLRRGWSVDQLQCEFDGSRLISLVANRTETRVRHRWIIYSSEDGLEARTIECVEPVGAELQLH